MVDFRDWRTIRDWYYSQQDEARVAFGARCALRAVPQVTLAQPEEFGGLALAIGRELLVSGVAAVVSGPRLRAAAAKAVAKVKPNSNRYVANACAAATKVLINAAIVGGPHPNEWPEPTTAAGAFADLASADSYWVAVFEDAMRIGTIRKGPGLFASPLWPDGMPEELSRDYDRLQALWAEDLPTWRFWRDWYEGMLSGEPMDWALQEAVALIPDEVWKAGPEAVAREIERIQASTPFLGEIVEDSPPPLPALDHIPEVQVSDDRVEHHPAHLPGRPDLETIYSDLQEDVAALAGGGSFDNISKDFDTAFRRFARICGVDYVDLAQVRFGVQAAAMRLRFDAERGELEAGAPERVGALEAILLSAELVAARLPGWRAFQKETAAEERIVAAEPEVAADILEGAAEELGRDPEHFDPAIPATLREYLDTATMTAYMAGTRLLADVAYVAFDQVRQVLRNVLKEGRTLVSRGLAASLILAAGEKLVRLSEFIPSEFGWIKSWVIYLGSLMPG